MSCGTYSTKFTLFCKSLTIAVNCQQLTTIASVIQSNPNPNTIRSTIRIYARS
nr:MAG TPA: hypothetical protein [Caudoviricetes sp.]